MQVAETVNDDDADESAEEELPEEDSSDEYDLETEDDAEVLDLGDAATELLNDEDAENGDLPLASDPQFAETAVPIASDLGENSDSELIEPLDLQETEEEQAVTAIPAPTISEPIREALVTMPETSDSPFAAASPNGETPIERMVRESLRPMLREWLDTNLPPIVEQMVKTELERIMGTSR